MVCFFVVFVEVRAGLHVCRVLPNLGQEGNHGKVRSIRNKLMLLLLLLL